LPCVAVCCSVLQCVDIYTTLSTISSPQLQCVAVCVAVCAAVCRWWLVLRGG